MSVVFPTEEGAGFGCAAFVVPPQDESFCDSQTVPGFLRKVGTRTTRDLLCIGRQDGVYLHGRTLKLKGAYQTGHAGGSKLTKLECSNLVFPALSMRQGMPTTVSEVMGRFVRLVIARPGLHC